MINITKKLATSIAAGSLLMSVFAPGAFAGYDGYNGFGGCGPCGNGSYSTNVTSIRSNDTTNISQNNSASISNNVSNNANTGGNSISGSTGGDNAIVTGSVNNTTNINNQANMNSLTVPQGCGCDTTSSVPLVIGGNGSRGTNLFFYDSSKRTSIRQNNNANFTNSVHNNGNTGNNAINSNTGYSGFFGKGFLKHYFNGNGGTNTVETGSVNSNTNINNEANTNMLH